MDMGPLEWAAFLYYCSRGIPPGLVNTFLNDRFNTRLRSAESMWELRQFAPWQELMGFNISETNAMILENIHRGDFTLEQFLPRLNFAAKEETLLKQIRWFDDVVNAQRSEDPLLIQLEAEFIAANPRLLAGTTAMTPSPSRAAPTLPAPAILSKRERMILDSSSFAYQPLGWGPGVPAGSSTSTPGEGSQPRSSEPAARESGPSNTTSTTGRTEPHPRPR